MAKSNQKDKSDIGIITRLDTNNNKIMDAYRSSLGNLFTSNDPTLSTQGYVERLNQSGYYGDVIKSLKIYQFDPFVKKMIDETVACSNTKLMFQTINVETKNVFKEWSERVNEDVPNVLPGLDTLKEWIILSLLKTGMAVPDFEWGTMVINGKTYNLPTKINVHPTLAIKLKSNPVKFGYEEVWLGFSVEYEKILRENATADVANTIKYMEMYASNNGKEKEMREVWHNTKTNKTDLICLKKPNAFAIKYKWSPQEPTYYAIPPLKPLFSSIAMKHKLQEADLSLLQRVINRIIHVKVGDKDNQPKPEVKDAHGNVVAKGTLAQYSEMWQTGEGTQIFTTDYTVSIEDKMPDLTLVLNQDKYLPCLQEIMGAFGIMQDPSTRIGSSPHVQLNLTKYEHYLQDLQKMATGYFRWLIKQILIKNPELDKSISVFMQLPYVDPSTQKSLWEMYMGGAIDVYTVLEAHDVDPEYIKQRKNQQAMDKNIDGENTWQPPTALVQIAKNGADTKKENLNSESTPGRPTNVEKKEKENIPTVKEVKQ
jgi:hypothetical protein